MKLGVSHFKKFKKCANAHVFTITAFRTHVLRECASKCGDCRSLFPSQEASVLRHNHDLISSLIFKVNRVWLNSWIQKNKVGSFCSFLQPCAVVCAPW